MVIKYKKKRIIIKICDYNFSCFVTYYRGVTIIYVNSKLTNKEKSKLLHKVIRRLKII